jgi:tetratricopeptide (TPR) repeat protein
MWKALLSGIFIIALPLSFTSCSTTYIKYSQNIFDGKRLLEKGEYQKAKEHFQEATLYSKDFQSLTYLAIAYYKMGDIENAAVLIQEAAKITIYDYRYLRTLGYGALILLKRDKEEGLEALKNYLILYRRCSPLLTIKDVRQMEETGQVDIDRLEKLIEEQVSWYENDIEQFKSTGTGFYDRSLFLSHPFGYR